MKIIFLKTTADLRTLSALLYKELTKVESENIKLQHRDSLNHGGEYALYKTSKYEVHLNHNNEETSPTEDYDWLDFQIYINNQNYETLRIIEILYSFFDKMDITETCIIEDV